VSPLGSIDLMVAMLVGSGAAGLELIAATVMAVAAALATEIVRTLMTSSTSCRPYLLSATPDRLESTGKAKCRQDFADLCDGP
jgi:hypothetical protein